MKPRYYNRHNYIFGQLKEGEKILDIGCAEGESTTYYSKKTNHIYGIDPNKELIKMAKTNFPKLNFSVGNAEEIPFENEFFDVVIMGDVLEHVKDENKSLKEINRVLKKDGILLLTVPHKGLFNFMDVDNYSWYYRKLVGIKTKKPGYENIHKHYSLKDLENLFKNKFEILNYYRSSLLLFPLILNLRLVIRHVFGEKTELIIKSYLNRISNLDFSIRYGRLSYCIGVYAKKI